MLLRILVNSYFYFRYMHITISIDFYYPGEAISQIAKIFRVWANQTALLISTV